jgi:acetyltransferase-like isoleucine patch superfamily enzyme
MTTQTVAKAADLNEFGLLLGPGAILGQQLVYERAVQLMGSPCVRNCQLGAFTYINGDLGVALFGTIVGRFSSIGGTIGAPEHPTDWLSSHPFTFMRPALLPRFDGIPEFVRWAPDGSESYKFPQKTGTIIGHDCWTAANCIIRRGLTVGHGAIVGAGSIVTKDVPPYAIMTGAPAKLLRFRFPEKTIERLLELEWWRYDISPFKSSINFSNIDQAVDVIGQLKSDGKLTEFQPDTFKITPTAEGYQVERQAGPLYRFK